MFLLKSLDFSLKLIDLVTSVGLHHSELILQGLNFALESLDFLLEAILFILSFLIGTFGLGLEIENLLFKSGNFLDLIIQISLQLSGCRLQL